ncbi:hypothetical protein KDN32_17400 [Nocardioides sp. J2M5]|uniref:hypothetical protein n=1 Tax=Nocardioides palaemonis TaxID=2829810 RepID=UPI001BA72DB8|nr:hypothetical protein [Nocardioides palaemonis]MBS2939521.1 hypothetical protein [Nocardioides palaemonis]
MTGSESTSTRGRPLVAVLAVLWVGLGFSAIDDGDMWRGAAGVALGAMTAATYLWPDSRFTTYMEKPLFRRKKHAEQVGTPDRG